MIALALGGMGSAIAGQMKARQQYVRACGELGIEPAPPMRWPAYEAPKADPCSAWPFWILLGMSL